MASIKVKSEYKKLVSLFNNLTGSRSLWQVFNDCIEMFALSIQNTFCFGQTFEKNENRYKDLDPVKLLNKLTSFLYSDLTLIDAISFT